MRANLGTCVHEENHTAGRREKAVSTGETFNPYRKWLGIRGCESTPNHYRLLGIVLFEDDLETIVNAAAQRLMFLQAIHARQTNKGRLLCERLLTEVSEARACLANPDAKKEYDHVLGETMDPAWLSLEDDDEVSRTESSPERNHNRGTDGESARNVVLSVLDWPVAKSYRLRCARDNREIPGALVYTVLLFTALGWGFILGCVANLY